MNFLISNGRLCYYILCNFKEHLSSHKDKYISQRKHLVLFKTSLGPALHDEWKMCYRQSVISCCFSFNQGVRNVCIKLSISKISSLQGLGETQRVFLKNTYSPHNNKQHGHKRRLCQSSGEEVICWDNICQGWRG